MTGLACGWLSRFTHTRHFGRTALVSVSSYFFWFGDILVLSYGGR